LIQNPVIESMMNRKSIRKYTKDSPSDEVIETIVRSAQQAPFAAQMCSLLLSRQKGKIPFSAPLLFTICVDVYKLEQIMARRNWSIGCNDLSLLLFGMQDAVLMAENLVIAGESLGLGSCFIGNAPYRAESIIKSYKLPRRVFPVVQLTMGYPDENPPLRPRYPLDFFLFENEYPRFSDETIDLAMNEMDVGFQAQDYYRQANYMVPLEGDRAETFTFDTYGWTEHMGRKWGQWMTSSKEILAQLSACGFDLTAEDK
jgi:FMN reductase (NADPH)